MRIKHHQLAGVLAVILAMTPNITWAIYLPVMLAFCIYAMYLKGISAFRVMNLAVLLGALLMISLHMPDTTRYNLLFFLIVLFSLVFSDLAEDPRFLRFVLDFGSYFILVTIFVGVLLPLGPMLQSRPDFDQHLLGFLRQRGLYSEPGLLGYWSAWLAYLSLVAKRYRSFVLYSLALFFASSAGAFLFFAALLITRIQNLSLKDVSLLGAFVAIVFGYLSEQIVAKFSMADTASLMNRLENAELTLYFIRQTFPYPAGFGPVFLDGIEFGVTSFLLLVPKSLGLLAIFALPLIWRLRSAPLTIFPILLISAVVGNFWETPILFALFHFSKHKRTGRLSYGREARATV